MAIYPVTQGAESVWLPDIPVLLKGVAIVLVLFVATDRCGDDDLAGRNLLYRAQQCKPVSVVQMLQHPDFLWVAAGSVTYLKPEWAGNMVAVKRLA